VQPQDELREEVRLTATNRIQKPILPSRSSRKRPVIFGNQKNAPASSANSSAIAIT
jgi:hypothetical protein